MHAGVASTEDGSGDSWSKGRFLYISANETLEIPVHFDIKV
jgi:hypothetical protein